MRVIIIGSGIAGLSAAIALHRVGIDAVVYERAPELREVGAGISLWANAIRALDYLGVGDAVRARSLGLRQSEIRTSQGHTIRSSFSAGYFERTLGFSPFVAMCHRADLVATLAEFLPAGTTFYGRECTGIEMMGDRVIVRFADGTTDEADAVIGADGIRSVVRSILFGPEEPRYAGYTCWRGVCPRLDSIEPGYIGEWWGRGKRFGITTIPNDRIYWFAVKNAPEGEHARDEHVAVMESYRGWAKPVEALIDSTPADKLLRNDIIDRPPIKVWSKGRAVLVGDAVHPTTPNLGQGGCMAIEDAVVLARLLKQHSDPGHAFQAFTAERYRRTSRITKESWQFGKIAQWEGRIACRLRDAMLGFVLPRFGQRSLMKYASFDVGPLQPVSHM